MAEVDHSLGGLRNTNLELKKTNILELQMNYTALLPAQVNSAVQILRSILPGISNKKQVVIYHPLHHGRTSGRVSSRYGIFVGNFSFSDHQQQSKNQWTFITCNQLLQEVS